MGFSFSCIFFFLFLSYLLKIDVAQKLGFDCGGARCQRRGQRQSQRLMVLMVSRLGLIVHGSGSGSRCCTAASGAIGGSAAARIRATCGTITSTDATNS